MDVPANVHELGIEKIIFGPAALKVNGKPVEVKLSYELLQERTAYCLRVIAVHDELLAALDRAVQDIESGWADDADERFPWLADARIAIAKAKGE
jgi:hypothetical protein